MGPADTLRRAAEILRERAAAALSEMLAEETWSYRTGEVHEGRYGFNGWFEWVALMSPELAEPLAAWLEFEANEAEYWDNLYSGADTEHAIAFARAIVGKVDG